jgi:hypothetical protein
MIAISTLFAMRTPMIAFRQSSESPASVSHSHLQGNFPPPAKQPVITAREVPRGTITLDGTLQESAWRLAEEVSNFFQQEPVQGAQN